MAHLIVLISLILTGCASYENTSAQQELYLGLKPPGMRPEVFAPGVVSIEDDNWHLGWDPEVGLVIPMGNPEIGLIANVRYNWALSAGGSGDQTYWGFNLGFVYR